MSSYAIYLLPDDPATHGQGAGKFIVTSADHDKEFSGPMSRRDATVYARLLETLTMLREDCDMALSGEWDRGDQGFQAMQEEIDRAIAEATGRPA